MFLHHDFFIDHITLPANGGGHQLHATELRHVGFNVCRIEPLLRNVQFQQLYQFTGDIVHDRLSEFILAQQFDVTFNRAAAQALLFRVQIQRILRVDVEHGRIGVAPSAELQRNDSAASLVTPSQHNAFCQIYQGLLSHASVLGPVLGPVLRSRPVLLAEHETGGVFPAVLLSSSAVFACSDRIPNTAENLQHSFVGSGILDGNPQITTAS